MTMMEFKSEIKYPFTMVPIKIEKMMLDPYAYRIYNRILFRASGSSDGHFESQENMAKEILISSKQIQRKLKILVAHNMIEIQKRGKNKDGHYMTNLIILLDFDKWVHATHSPIAMRLTVPPPCDSQSDITRSPIELDPFLTNDAEKKSTASKNPLPQKLINRKSKMKPWEKKSEEEKMDTLLNMTCDSHRLGTQQDKRIKPFPFDDVPDLLLPVLEQHGLEKVKEFLEQGRILKIGYNVRCLGAEVLKWMDKKLDKSKPILANDERQEEQSQSKENNFPQQIVEQVNRNMTVENKEKTTDEILSNLPIEFKDFVNNLKPMQKRAFAKDLKEMKNEEIRNAYLNSIFIKKRKNDFEFDSNLSI